MAGDLNAANASGGIRADVDAIRAAAELARRQAQHVTKGQEYVHSSCSAQGAFYGVLGFFAGTYESALRNVGDGLAGSVRTSNFAAENFDACATAYQESDRASHAAFVQVCTGTELNVDSYQPTGSGMTTVGGPLQRAEAAAGAATPDAEESWADFAKRTGIEVGKNPALYTREYMQYRGEYVRKDSVLEGTVEDGPSRFEPDLERDLDEFNKPIERILDSNKERREQILDKYTPDLGQATQTSRYGTQDAYISTAVQHNGRAVAGLYSDYQTVAGTKQAVTDSYKDLADSTGDVARYHDISNDDAELSALQWSEGR